MSRIKLELPASFPFSASIPLRITDINYGGHLGNDAILSIMHEARMQFFRHFNCSELNLYGASVIMADVAIVYKAEGFYGDVLQVDVTAADFSRVSFDLFYRIINPGKGITIAEAKTGMVCFNYNERKVASVPEEFVRLFKL